MLLSVVVRPRPLRSCPRGKDAPAEIEEEEEGGEGAGDEYDDDGFEEYSDDSTERNGGRQTGQATSGAVASTAREGIGLGTIATAAGSNPEFPLLSPVVNKRLETVPAPDDEVSSLFGLKPEGVGEGERGSNSRAGRGRMWDVWGLTGAFLWGRKRQCRKGWRRRWQSDRKSVV